MVAEETSSSCQTEESSSTDAGAIVPSHIPPYVDFSDFYCNVQLAKLNGTLPPELNL